MEFVTYSTKQNELIRLNPDHVVALRSFINDDGTSARFEIHTTGTLVIVQEFADVDKMKDEFERVERLLSITQPKPKGYQPSFYKREEPAL